MQVCRSVCLYARGSLVDVVLVFVGDVVFIGAYLNGMREGFGSQFFWSMDENIRAMYSGVKVPEAPPTPSVAVLKALLCTYEQAKKETNRKSFFHNHTYPGTSLPHIPDGELQVRCFVFRRVRYDDVVLLKDFLFLLLLTFISRRPSGQKIPLWKIAQ